MIVHVLVDAYLLYWYKAIESCPATSDPSAACPLVESHKMGLQPKFCSLQVPGTGVTREWFWFLKKVMHGSRNGTVDKKNVFEAWLPLQARSLSRIQQFWS